MDPSDLPGPASLMATQAQLEKLDEAHRTQQATSAGALVLALAQVWKGVEPASLATTGTTWLSQAIALIASRRHLSGLYAMRYARQVRQLQVGLDDAPAAFGLDLDVLIREWEQALGGAARGRGFVELGDLPTVPGIAAPNVDQIRESLIHVGLRQTGWDLSRVPGRRVAPEGSPDLDPQEFVRDGERIGRENQSIAEMEQHIMTAAQQRVGAAATRHARSGARDAVDDVVRSDKKARGYIRITRPACCWFCAMLASRGPVFSEDSFAQSDPRFTGPGDHKVHDLCGCVLRPVYTRDGTEWTSVARESSDLWETLRSEKGRTPRREEFKDVWNRRNASLRASMQ